MGRFQNPFLECQLGTMIKDEVELVRRQSGGGCVYHDLGNLNYSFITNKTYHNKDTNHKIIIDALKTFDIDAFSTKRVDLFLTHEGLNKKFSGSAFKEKKDTAFHHGTLLVDSNLDKLNYYLTPKDLSVKSVSIASVRSKVVNLKSVCPQITISKLVDAIVSSASVFYNCSGIEVINPKLDQAHLDQLQVKSWYLGETPKFVLDDYINEFGSIEIEIKKLKVIDFEISNSDLHVSFIEVLKSSLKNKSLLKSDYITDLKVLAEDYTMYKGQVNALIHWLDHKFSVLRK
jgi:lipoate-protein ligase A